MGRRKQLKGPLQKEKKPRREKPQKQPTKPRNNRQQRRSKSMPRERSEHKRKLSGPHRTLLCPNQAYECSYNKGRLEAKADSPEN